MKSTHITRAIAVIMTLVMLLSCVPSSVLPVLASTDSATSSSIFDNVTLGKGTVTNTEVYNSSAATDLIDVKGNATVSKTYSPYEPYATTDEDHPFLPSGNAWIDLKDIYYGAPATPNYPITEWSANTSVVNITDTGKTYPDDTATYGVPAGTKEYAFADHNLIDEYLWAGSYATVDANKAKQNGVMGTDTTDNDESLTNTKSNKVYFYAVKGSYKKRSDSTDDVDYSKEPQFIFYNSQGKIMRDICFIDDYRGDEAGIGAYQNEIKKVVNGEYIPLSCNSDDGEHTLTINGETQTCYMYHYTRPDYNLVESGNTVYFHAYYEKGVTADDGVTFYNTETDDAMDITWEDTDDDQSIDQGSELTMNGKTVSAYYLRSDDNTHYYYMNQDTADDDTAVRVYNRYDAMQGKWGLTLDKNVSSVVWAPTYAANYYGTNGKPGNEESKNLNNGDLYLSDTPYLYYSTEAPEGTRMAISLLIGTPVQEEKRNKQDSEGKTLDFYNSLITQSAEEEYEFRWYTITDNSDRPGVDDPDTTDVDESNLDASMVPVVYVSDVVYDNWVLTDSSGDLLAMMYARDPDSVNPLRVAENEGYNTKKLYVDGSITGCIDFTQILPLLTAASTGGYDTNGSGREDVKYKIAQIRVDTQTAQDATDSACRLNYLYFAPGQAAIFTPQSTVGNDVIATNWQYKQHDDGIGDQTPNYVETAHGIKELNADGTVTTDRSSDPLAYKSNYVGYGGENSAANDMELGYTNGWENGQAVSITNTPNDRQQMTIDVSGGKLVSYLDAYNERLAKLQTQDAADGADDDLIDGKSIYWLADLAFTHYDYNDGNGDTLQDEIYNTETGSNYSHYYKVTKGDETYYFAAETFNKEDYYVMVTVPVRKWINVLGDSRKLTFTMNVEQYSDNKLEPTFCIWGNRIGSLGAGHADHRKYGRFHYEDMLGVFGNGYYQVDGFSHNSTTVDRTLGDSVIYNDASGTTASWFDWLRSPYVFDHVVKNANADYCISDAMAGYTYVSAIRFAVPCGTKFTVSEMKGDGNSAGLNAYAESGDIIDAPDGGTGVQPEIDTKGTTTGKTVQSVKIDTGDITYDSTTTTIKGTQSAGAAAYGPMLAESFYTIYDLLDTERINETGYKSSATGNAGKSSQHVYGQMWQVNGSDICIWSLPKQEGTTLGYTYNNTQFAVYATVKLTTEDQLWGVVGVLSNPSWGNGEIVPRIGFALLKDGSSEYATMKAGKLLWEKTYDSYDVFLSSWDPVSSNEETVWSAVTNNITASLENEWTVSNFLNDLPTFHYQNSAGTPLAGLSNNSDFSVVDKAPRSEDIYNPNTEGVQPMYANMWNKAPTATNSSQNLMDTTFAVVNNTDLELTLKRKENTDSHSSVGMTRIFKNPVRLHTNSTHNSFPVLYWDVTTENTSSFKLAISVRVMKDSDQDGSYDDPQYDLLFLDDDSGLVARQFDSDSNKGLSGKKYGYFSFEQYMKDNAISNDGNNEKNNIYPRIDILGVSLYRWQSSSNTDDSTVTIRRLEVWQEETTYLDTIIADNQVAGGSLVNATNESMTAQVKDSMNIINHAYYHQHDEAADNASGQTSGFGLTKTENTASGVNNGKTWWDHTDNTNADQEWDPKSDSYRNLEGPDVNDDDVPDTYKYADETFYNASYRKTNSNKGWSAYIQSMSVDEAGINRWGNTYQSVEFNAKDNTVFTIQDDDGNVQNIYEYHTALGNLRVWGAAGTTTSVVFTADRSFNTSNYRYLYYSYSMRDVEGKIAAENSEDSGIAVAIKQHQEGSSNALVQRDGSWEYFPDGTSYWHTTDNKTDYDCREFTTTMNAVIDLESTPLDSVNQIVFYLKNAEADTAEFYINYVTLSNVEPETLIQTELEQETTQYYYLMDNTGDRYSARFPTIDNPTGAVSDESQRVNPLKVTRGDTIDHATYFNGDDLDAYADYTNGEYYSSNGSYGYDGSGNALTDILFYAGTLTTGEDDDVYDIQDFYDYKTESGTIGDIYDMMWSYGRWYSETNEGGMNKMYVADGTTEDEPEDTVTGNLVRRYATENYVLLREGIKPKTYVTYYDADGGEFLYANMEADSVENLQKLTENSYYTTNNVVLSYFTQPRTLSSMKTGANGERDEQYFLQKPGYKFDGWIHIDSSTGMVDTAFNEALQGSEATDEEKAELLLYIRKSSPGTDYFKAKWVKLEPTDADYSKYYRVDENSAAIYDKDGNPVPRTYDVTFYSSEGTQWTTVSVGRTESDYWNTPYAVQLPSASLVIDGVRTSVYGWTPDDGKTVYAPGTKLYILEDGVEFTAVGADTAAAANVLHTITVQNAQLYVLTQSSINGETIIKEQLADKRYGITATTKGDGTYTYYNVPHDIRLVARPDTASESFADDGWIEIADTKFTEYNENLFAKYDASSDDGTLKKGLDHVKTNSVVLSDDTNLYFTSSRDITVQYADVATHVGENTFYAEDKGAFVTIVPNITDDACDKERVHFTSRFEIPKDAKCVAAGTLYTKNTYYDAFDDVDKTMRLKEETINDESIKATEDGKVVTYECQGDGAVRFTQATLISASNEYTLSIGLSSKKTALYLARAYVIYTTVDENGKVVYNVAYSPVTAFNFAEILE